MWMVGLWKKMYLCSKVTGRWYFALKDAIAYNYVGVVGKRESIN